MFPKETQDNLLRIAINLPEFHAIPKAGHITNYSKAESTVRPAMLRYSTTQFVNVSLCCISLTWNSFIVAFFFLDGFSAMQQNKNVWIPKWPVKMTGKMRVWPVKMTGKTRVWPVKSAIRPDIVRWSAVIVSPEQNKINKRVTDFSCISMKMI